MSITIAVDCMGGDHGPSVTVPAVFDFLRRDPDCTAIMVGREADLRPFLGGASEFGERLRVHHASEVVGMDEPVATALRNKKDSSMRVVADLVKNGTANAAISAGNTGALMAISRFVLKTLPGIDRPAIASILPTAKGQPMCWISVPTSIARRSTFSSSASWAPCWFPRSSIGTDPALVC